MSTLEKEKYLHNLFLTISNPDEYQLGITEDILEDTRRNTPNFRGNRYLTWRSEWGFEVFEYYEQQRGSTLPKEYIDGLKNPRIFLEYEDESRWFIGHYIKNGENVDIDSIWNEHGEPIVEVKGQSMGLTNSFFFLGTTAQNRSEWRATKII